ncbi:helix-turn-helix transcriptional regulator [Paenibacillus sp. FSL R5-0928]
MAERNLSRKEVEEATGINRNTMSRLYNDKAVSIETLAVICDYLGCRIEDVVEFVPATD